MTDNTIEYKACSLHSKSGKDIAVLSKLTIDKLLNLDLYATFRGILSVDEESASPVIIKFFIDISDKNNEFEVLLYLQKHCNPEIRHLFPKPYLYFDFGEEEMKLRIIGSESRYVSKIIIYEYMIGAPLRKMPTDRSKLIKDVKVQLLEMHRLGLVHGDVKLNNIIKMPSTRFDILGSYRLIDFGRTFSVHDKSLPPMAYMIEVEHIPTQKADILALKSAV